MIKTINKSIEHWNKIIVDESSDRGKSTFPLCVKYWDNGHCTECPIKAETKLARCLGTPYADWFSHQINDHGKKEILPKTVKCKKCLDIALKYEVFLKYILRKEKYAKDRKID